MLGSYSVLHCVLAEIDAQIHGCAKYYRPLSVKGRDSTWLIRAAGWPDFEYQDTDWQQARTTTRVQLADKFGLVLYLATISEDKHDMRKKAYEDFLEAVEDTDDGHIDLMQEVSIDSKPSAMNAHTVKVRDSMISSVACRWSGTSGNFMPSWVEHTSFHNQTKILLLAPHPRHLTYLKRRLHLSQGSFTVKSSTDPRLMLQESNSSSYTPQVC